MITLVLSLGDAVRHRFAISPLGKTAQLSRSLALPHDYTQGAPAAWLRQHELARRRLERERDLRQLLRLMASSHLFLDFLTLIDESALGDIERELDEVRMTLQARARTEIERTLSAHAL